MVFPNFQVLSLVIKAIWNTEANLYESPSQAAKCEFFIILN